MKPNDFVIGNDWLSSVEPDNNDFIALGSIIGFAFVEGKGDLNAVAEFLNHVEERYASTKIAELATQCIHGVKFAISAWLEDEGLDY